MTPEYCLSPSCSELAQVRAMLHEITEQNDRLELENGILLSSRNDWKELAKAKDARVAELEAGIRDALSRDMPNTSRSKLLAALNP